MSESSNQSATKPEKSWLSWLMIVFGVFAFIAAAISLASGGFGFVAGLTCIAAAGVFLALSRILDYLQEIVHRQNQSDKDSKI